MIIHISIPATHPENVARTLAELVQGTFKPLNWCPGGYMVFTDNQYSTGIEVLPRNTLFLPGTSENQTLTITHSEQQQASQYSCLHFLLVIDSSYDNVFAIAKRAGWRAVRKCSLNAIDMVELWIENNTMTEIVLSSEKEKAISALKSNHYTGC